MTKCSFCNREAVYYRANEGNYYCKYHFIKSIEKKVKKTIREYKLINPGDRIAVSLSGGKDSASLLYMLHKFFKNNPKIEIFAISIDEGISEHRTPSIEEAEKLTKMLGVEHYIFSFKDEFGFTVEEIADYVLEKGKHPCEYCAVLRRWLLNRKSRELGANKIAAGFNLDDEAESLIMNIIKGDMLRIARLSPFSKIINHPKFVPRIKPLMFIPESEVKLYANLNNLPYHSSFCPFRKFNFMRVETHSYLNTLEEKSPGIKHMLIKNGLKLAEIVKETISISSSYLKECSVCGEPTTSSICKACQIRKEIEEKLPSP